MTFIFPNGSRIIFNFNSHAHVERDSRDLVNELNTADFNSHAHVERDMIGQGYIPEVIRFQLTRSRGA